MIARMLTVRPKPEEFDTVASFWNGERSDTVRKQKGNLGFMVLADKQNGSVVAISTWTSNTDAEASAPVLRKHLEELGSKLAGPPAPSLYDVQVAS